MDFTHSKILFVNRNLTLTSVYDHFTFKNNYIVQTNILGSFKNELLNKLKNISSDNEAIKITINFLNERNNDVENRNKRIY